MGYIILDLLPLKMMKQQMAQVALKTENLMSRETSPSNYKRTVDNSHKRQEDSLNKQEVNNKMRNQKEKVK